MADRSAYRFTAPLWRSSGDTGWYFVTVPFDVSDEIDELSASSRKGFGSVRVEVTIGASTWSTSLFPDSKKCSFVLPVKQAIRKAQRLDAGDQVTVSLGLADEPGS